MYSELKSLSLSLSLSLSYKTYMHPTRRKKYSIYTAEEKYIGPIVRGLYTSCTKNKTSIQEYLGVTMNPPPP